MFGLKLKNIKISEEQIRESLKKINYPGLSRDIVSFGMIKSIVIENGTVDITIEVSTRNPEVVEHLEQSIKKTIGELSGVTEVKITKKINTPPEQSAAHSAPQPETRKFIDGVRYRIAIASGKGGVGKSTVSVNLAVKLQQMGYTVGLLDCDIYGPSIPMMMGVEGTQPLSDGEFIYPVEKYDIKLMSIGFFIPRDTPLIWRGPMIQKAVEQMLGDVKWGSLDYLIIDLPPGTGDAQLSLSQLIALSGVIIVTTPQDISLINAVKGVQMFRKINVPILGIIENMSYFLCPHCGHQTDIFSRGGGCKESQRLDVPFLGEIPLIPEIRDGGDKGIPWVSQENRSNDSEIYNVVVNNILEELKREKLQVKGGNDDYKR